VNDDLAAAGGSTEAATLRTTCVAATANMNCRVLPGDSLDSQVNTMVEGVVHEGPASPMRELRAVRRTTDTLLAPRAHDPEHGRGSDRRHVPAGGWNSDLMACGAFLWTGTTSAFMDVTSAGMTSSYEGQTFLYELVKALSKAK